ncbi:MAG: hypothetical protein J0H49_08255 [Acidobacteria bacterium]|nr:hypothetical protein [Acidobacteriota bacterium]
MWRWITTVLAPASLLLAQPAPTPIHIRQVVAGGVYLDQGSATGLAEGMKVTFQRLAPGEARMSAKAVGEGTVVSVATQSAFCEIKATVDNLQPEPGDLAVLAAADQENLERIRNSARRQRYAQVVSFTSGDPLEEEVREYVPSPPLSEEGRLTGRLGFEWNSLNDRSGAGLSSHQEGMAIRIDWTRIEGSYWSISGYWRGRVNSTNGGQAQTLTDLVNRTYHIGLFYSNPRSPYQMGFGRILLPWASSLSTLDGGYLARSLGKTLTVGVFAGSTPDPSQWNYDPNRQMLGTFLNAQRGNYESARWSGTLGVAITRVRWRPERQFLFAENSIFVGTKFTLLHTMEADQRNPKLFNGQTGLQLTRSFTSARFQPHRRVTFDLSHNHLRGTPTFDVRLLGTGLLDNFLFQGFSGGIRLQPIERLTLSGNWGRSHRENDPRSSLNQMYSAGWSRLPWISSRLEGRYSSFTSSFGTGRYSSVTLTRNVGEQLRLEAQAGQQEFHGALTQQTRARFIGGTIDWSFSRHYFITGGWMTYRGQVQNYDQTFLTLGYRF